MKCAEFETHIQNLLDARRAPDDDAAVREHAADCAACRKRLAGYEALLDGVDLFEAPALKASFAEDVVGAALVGPVASRRRWLSWRTALSVVAAAAAVVVLVALPRSAREHRPVQNVPGRAPGFAAIQPPQPAPVEVPARAAEPRALPAPHPAANVAAAPRSEADDMQQYRHLVENLTPQLPQAPPGWVNHLAGGIRPVANTFGEALQVLRRSLPSSRDENRPTKPSAEHFVPAGYLIVV